jgi:AcrR family transcriptional regulator
MESDMKEMQETRRVRMTKRLMKDALLELLAQKNLSSISVKELCETADVHRTTFYLHYTDTADLLREIEQDFLDQIPTPPRVIDEPSQEQLLEATTVFFDYVKQNGDTIRILFSESSESSFLTRLVEYLCSGYIPVREAADAFSARYIQLYIANGTVGMLREWVDQDFPISSRRIAEMMYYLSRKLTA